jgi:hypothetical protein
MNGSKEIGFIWWAVGGCASRITCGFFRSICPDFLAYDASKGGISLGPSHGFVHSQGIPPELKGLPIISNGRNPYAKLVMEYGHYEQEEEYGGRKDTIKPFEKWILKRLTRAKDDDGLAPWIKWEELGYPAYHIRTESLEKDIRKIQFLFDKIDSSLLETQIQNCFSENLYKSRRESIKYTKEGLRIWEHYYNQELADYVYSILEEGFKLMCYERDSWKIN